MKELTLFILAALLYLITAVLIGCVYTRFRDKQGTEITQLGPKGVAMNYTPGTTQPGTPPAFGSGTVPKTAEELRQGQADKLMWAGIGMCIVGGLTLAFKSYLTVVPGTAGTYMLGMGGLAIVSSYMLINITPAVWNILFVVLILGVVLYAQGFISNQKTEKRKVARRVAVDETPLATTTTTTETTT